MILMLFALALNATSQSGNIYSQLSEDEGWKEFKEKGDFTFRRKPINGFDLYALEIRKIVDITPESIFAVLLDVNNYKELLGDSKYLEAEEVFRDENVITGYQFARIPVIPNRHYLFDFDLHEYKRALQDSTYKLGWTLLNPEGIHSEFIQMKNEENNNPIYIKNGAGIWLITEIAPGSYENSYRLYLDPNGWMPGWLVNTFNVKNLQQLFEQVLAAAAEKE